MQLLENGTGSGNEEDELYMLQQAIGNSDLSPSDIRKLIEGYSFSEILSSFVEGISPVVETFPEPVLSRWVDEYSVVAAEKSEVDCLALSRERTLFDAVHKQYGARRKSSDQQWDEDVLWQPYEKKSGGVPVSEKKQVKRKGKRATRLVVVDVSNSDDESGDSRGMSGSVVSSPKRSRKPKDKNLLSASGTDWRVSHVPGKDDDYARMRQLVDGAARLRAQINDPLDDLRDSSDEEVDSSDVRNGSRGTSRKPRRRVQMPDSPGIELGWNGSEKEDDSESDRLPIPLRFPRLKYRHRDSLELPSWKTNAKGGQSVSGQQKRNKWLRQEEDNLKLGVKALGVGRWAEMLTQYEFQSCRTSVSLKDKWRNIVKYGQLTSDDDG